MMVTVRVLATVGEPTPEREPGERPADDGEGRTRTGDTSVFSRVLYQLSYLASAGQCSGGRAGTRLDRRRTR